MKIVIFTLLNGEEVLVNADKIKFVMRSTFNVNNSEIRFDSADDSGLIVTQDIVEVHRTLKEVK